MPTVDDDPEHLTPVTPPDQSFPAKDPVAFRPHRKAQGRRAPADVTKGVLIYTIPDPLDYAAVPLYFGPATLLWARASNEGNTQDSHYQVKVNGTQIGDDLIDGIPGITVDLGAVPIVQTDAITVDISDFGTVVQTTIIYIGFSK